MVLISIQLFIHLFKHFLVELFTLDSSISEIVISILQLTSICILFDGLVTASIGVVKGIGRQVIATCAYVVCFYLISVPFSYYMCFNRELGLSGLWIGQVVGLAILLLSLSQIIARADW